MGSSSSAAWTASRQMLGTAVKVYLSYVGPDTMYSVDEWPEVGDFDRCYGVAYIGGVFFSSVGFHYPIGKFKPNNGPKDLPYSLGEECWIKKANAGSFELVIGEVDPVATVSRRRDSDEVLDLPE